MFSNILHRPALAIVISVIIVFLGGLAINTLPISQFPSVAPPSVIVSVSYPGASANVLVDSVLIILEGIRQVRDGDKIEYEFRAPEEVLGNLKYHAE